MGSLPSASVVLCTFQGERFLAKQLASIRAQTISPLEWIIQDDASTDGTWELLEGELAKAGQVAVQLFRNTERLGFAKNFASALAKAKGEVIFLSDQDDLWEREKIEILLNRFAQDPELLLACSEASLIDQSDAVLPGAVLAGNGLDPKRQLEWEQGKALSFLIQRNPVPGMVIAFRSRLLSLALPIPEGWEHDYWLLLLAAGLTGRIAVEARPLALYRQHESQAIGGKRGFLARWRRASRMSLKERERESQRYHELWERLRRGGAPEESLLVVAEKRDHLIRRAQFSCFRPLRAAQIGFELLSGAYHRYDAGLSSAWKDFLAARA